MAQDSQFVIARARPEAVSRLFCFPHAGGGPVAFFDWSERFGAETECVALQYAGRGQRLRERPLTSVEALVKEIAGNVAGLLDKPFSFYGHSFGGVVAFELAREMRRLGLPEPDHLFVGASRPPHLEREYPPIHHLADGEFVENVQTRYGGIPAAIYRDPEVLEMFLPAMRADFTAYETYRFSPGAPLDLPIAAFAGADDRAVKPETLGEWTVHTTSDFDLTVLPGGHFFPTTSAKQLTRAMETRIAAHLNEPKSTLAS